MKIDKKSLAWTVGIVLGLVLLVVSLFTWVEFAYVFFILLGVVLSLAMVALFGSLVYNLVEEIRKGDK